ncbi:DMT family transporter [Candidatus Gottesmanbacteria bacterium]|nr:DMT family transporter [Candidatus Gottesmanbacteria bacterium]
MWFILSFTSALIFTAVNLLMRVLAVKSEHTRTFSVVFNLWGALFALLLFLTQLPSTTLPTGISPATVLFIILAILFYGIYERFHFSARQAMDASTTSVIFRLAPVIAFAGSLVLFHETLTWEKLFGAGFILIASFVIIHKNPQITFSRPFFAALISAAALGIAWIMDKPASAGFPPAFYSFILWTMPLLVIAFPLPTVTQLKKEALVGGWKVALVGFLNVLGYVIQIKALSIADASRVIPVTSSSGTLIVLAGIFLLKEKTFMTRKLIAGVLMFIGILLLR